MATSQNGWPVYTSGTHPDLVAIPKILGRVRRGDVATIFTYLVNRFDREVEDVDAGRDDWGYAYRAVRGKTSGYSNHASATAIDLNATRHPLGKAGTFSAAQVRAIRSILGTLGGVVRWGGDYSGRKDEMHFEINANAARVAQVARSLASHVSKPAGGSGSGPSINLPSGGLPAPILEDFMATMSDEEKARLLRAADRVLGALPGKENGRSAYPRVLDVGDGQHLINTMAANRNQLAEFIRAVVNAAVATVPTVDQASVEKAVTAAAHEAFSDFEITKTETTIAPKGK